MASYPPRIREWKQAAPAARPKNGFRLPSYRITPYARGPPGFVLLLGGVAVVGIGFYRWTSQKSDHDYHQSAKLTERYERAYVMQAMEDASYERRLKESLDRERAWMADKPEWVTNKSVYFTEKQDRTVNNPLDSRSMDRIDPNN